MAGIESDAISIFQLPFTLVLLVGIFVLVDIQLSDVVPGANDNASGVATALSLAAELDSAPPDNLDVWVVLPGAEECLQEGMRAFVRAHRSELAERPTYFVNLDTVGNGRRALPDVGRMGGRLRDGPPVGRARRGDRRGGSGGDGGAGATPLAHGLAGDEMPARLAGFPAITLTCTDADGYAPHYHLPSDTPDNVDADALERAHAFALELIRQLDRDVGRRGTG